MEYFNEIDEFVHSVWSSVLEMDVLASDKEVSPSSSDDNYLTGIVTITGDWNGAVSIDCPEPLAKAIASSMFDMELDEISESEVRDALGEVTNMIGGNFKSILGCDTQLSIPTIVNGHGYHLAISDGELITRSNFESQQQTFRIRIFKQKDE